MKARENILSKIKKALEAPKKRLPKPNFLSDVYLNYPEEHIEVIFAENFKKKGGDFFYTQSIEEAMYQLRAFLNSRQITSLFSLDENLKELCRLMEIKVEEDFQVKDSPALLGFCELLVAQNGSLLMKAPPQSLQISPLSVHLVFAYSSQLVYDVQSALLISKDKYSEATPPTLYFTNLVEFPHFMSPIHFPRRSFAGELILFLIDDISEELPNPRS